MDPKDKKISYLNTLSLFEETFQNAQEIVKNYKIIKERFRDYWEEAESKADEFEDTLDGKVERYRAEIAKKFFDKVCDELKYANQFKDEWKLSIESLKKNEHLFLQDADADETDVLN